MLVLCKTTLLPTTETERMLIKSLNFEDSFQSLYAWMPVLHYQRVVAKPSHRKYQFTQLYPEDLNSYHFHLTAACCLPFHKILSMTKKKKKKEVGEMTTEVMFCCTSGRPYVFDLILSLCRGFWSLIENQRRINNLAGVMHILRAEPVL